MSLFSFLRKNKQSAASTETRYTRVDSEPAVSRSRSKGRKGAQGREAVDPMLPEKKRARRRLIGAVALVLSAIIGLPMLLDSEPRPLADDIAIQIPSKDKPAPSRPASQVKPESSSPESSAGLPPTAALDPREEVIEPPAADKAGKADKADKAEKAEKAEKLEKAARPDAAVALAGKPAQEAHAVPPKPAAPAPAKEPRETPKHADAAKSEPRHEARQEVRDTAKADTAKKPVAEKPAVTEPRDDKALARLTEKNDETSRAKALLEGKTDPKDASERNGNTSSKYLVQVAALASQEKVSELQAKLRDAGIKSYTQKINTESGDRIRIRVGPFTSREEADKVRAKIAKMGLGGTVVPS